MAVQADLRNDEIVQMEPMIERNNLEKYLDCLKEEEIDYCIGQKEVEFIQSGIETLVQKIYDLVTKGRKDRVDCKNYDNILKVGSFYEGTKIKFPNEFDFIFVLSKRESCKDEYSKLLKENGIDLELEGKPFNWDEISLKLGEKPLKSLKYSENATRTIYFKKIVEESGPATKLRFIYQKNKSKDICLHVDIVPAYKITDPQLSVSVDYICSIEPILSVQNSLFRKEIVDTGSFLLVNKGRNKQPSFTETEVHFMKHTLSLKHVMVYKLLKYLMGGHGHAEKLRKRKKGVALSSYMIKLAMIEHHYQCRNTDSEEKGPCVLTVLEDLLRYVREESFQHLRPYTSGLLYTYSQLKGFIKKDIKHFRRLQKSTEKLNFVSMSRKLKPVAKVMLVQNKAAAVISFILALNAAIAYICFINCWFCWANCCH